MFLMMNMNHVLCVSENALLKSKSFYRIFRPRTSSIRYTPSEKLYFLKPWTSLGNQCQYYWIICKNNKWIRIIDGFKCYLQDNQDISTSYIVHRSWLYCMPYIEKETISLLLRNRIGELFRFQRRRNFKHHWLHLQTSPKHDIKYSKIIIFENTVGQLT